MLGVCGHGPKRAPEDDPGGHQPFGDLLFSAQRLGGHPGRRAPSFLKGEAHPVYLFVPALPVIAFWLLDAWYLRQERLFRRLYDEVRLKEGAADFSMDTRPFRRVVGSVMQVALSRTLLLFYGPVLIVLVLLESLLLPKAR
jgi:hypothetical protein